MSKQTYQYDHNTGQEIVREANDEEIELLKLGKKGREERLEAQAERQAARSSALAKLAALGLTEYEIASL